MESRAGQPCKACLFAMCVPLKNPQLGTSTKNWIKPISKEVQEKIGGKWPEIVHDICIFIAKAIFSPK